MPVPSRIQGEPRDGPATLLASTTFCREPGRLANQLPMTTTGKVQRRYLRIEEERRANLV
jgi:hypothetical protein